MKLLFWKYNSAKPIIYGMIIIKSIPENIFLFLLLNKYIKKRVIGAVNMIKSNSSKFINFPDCVLYVYSLLYYKILKKIFIKILFK